MREYVGLAFDGKRDRECATCRTEKEAEREQARMIAMRDVQRNRSGRCTFGQCEDLSLILGHTNINTTYRYVRPDVKDLRRGMDSVL